MTALADVLAGVPGRVARGVVWLDENDPGWWRTDAPARPDVDQSCDPGGPIDPDALDMSHPCYCVLGQRWGNYYAARISIDEALSFGFDAQGGADLTPDLAQSEVTGVLAAIDTEFTALTAEWTRVIEGRREVEAARRAAACCPCRGLLCDPECACQACPKTESDLED